MADFGDTLVFKSAPGGVNAVNPRANILFEIDIVKDSGVGTYGTAYYPDIETMTDADNNLQALYGSLLKTDATGAVDGDITSVKLFQNTVFADEYFELSDIPDKFEILAVPVDTSVALDSDTYYKLVLEQVLPDKTIEPKA